MQSTIEAIREHERAINASRDEFIQLVQANQGLQANQIEYLTSQLHLRLQNYHKIKSLRRQIKNQLKTEDQKRRVRTYDFTLQIRAESEIKQYDFVDRCGNDLGFILERLKTELS